MGVPGVYPFERGTRPQIQGARCFGGPSPQIRRTAQSTPHSPQGEGGGPTTDDGRLNSGAGPLSAFTKNRFSNVRFVSGFNSRKP